MQVNSNGISARGGYTILSGVGNVTVDALDAFGSDHYQQGVGAGVAEGMAIANGITGVCQMGNAVFGDNGTSADALHGMADLVKMAGNITQACGAPVQGAIINVAGVVADSLLNLVG